MDQGGSPPALFAEDRRGFEESRFWFQDTVHYAEPYYPFDVVCLDSTVTGFSQASARLFVVPTSLGLEHRILGGYVYLSPSEVGTTNRRALAWLNPVTVNRASTSNG